MKLSPEPQVFLLASTRLRLDGVEAFLGAVGVDDHMGMTGCYEAGEPGEALIELAGRTCYRSYEVGLNPNVKKIRKDREGYIGNILKSKHGSVFEHATATFAFFGVSRVFTHEIVRHRAGTAFSQESLRYVRITDIPFWIPPTLDCGDSKGTVTETVEGIEQNYQYLVRYFGIEEMTDFNHKKALTSALRRILPIGLSTCIIVTANHRAWRHIIEQRCSGHGEEEIELVMHKIAARMIVEFPSIYQDMVMEREGVWTFKHSKV